MTLTSPEKTIAQAELEAVENLRREMAKVIVGQEYLVERLLPALLSNSHVLLEGVPGLGKTLRPSPGPCNSPSGESGSRPTCCPPT